MPIIYKSKTKINEIGLILIGETTWVKIKKILFFYISLKN